MQDTEFNDLMWKQMINTKHPHHEYRGWSSIGYCKGLQLINHWYGIPFNPENTIPGTGLHEYCQLKLFPAGSIFADRYYIIAHEAPVFLKINGRMRWSYIDTLVWDSVDKVFEVWDYKGASSFAIKYKRDHAAPANIMQINLYGHLSIASRIRIIYVDKGKYSSIYSHVLDVSKRLANIAIQRMIMIDKARESKTAIPFHELIYDDLISEKPNCSWCPHCKFSTDVNGKNHPPYCLYLLKQSTKIDFSSWTKARDYVKALNL